MQETETTRPALDSGTTPATLYDRCQALFDANRALVNMSMNLSNVGCDGYLGLVSPGGGITFQLTFYAADAGSALAWSKAGYFAVWKPGVNADGGSFMHPDGRFKQRPGGVSAGVAESVITRFTPVRLDDTSEPAS